MSKEEISNYTLCRIVRHVALFVFGSLIVILAARWSHLTGDDNIMSMGAREMVALSLATSYASILFLSITLLIGPARQLMSKKLPLSSYLRRDIGIWAAVFAIVHTVTSMLIELGPVNAFDFFFYRAGASAVMPVRLDFFGIANYLGLIAGLIFILLLVLSSDGAIRMLKPSRWKRLQRWIYAGALITVAHGIMYQMMGQRSLSFVLIFAVLTIVTVGGQIWGFFRRRSEQRTKIGTTTDGIVRIK